MNFTPAQEMDAGLLVKISGSAEVDLCGAGEGASMIGYVGADITDDEVDDGQLVSVVDRKTPGLATLVSAKALAAGATLYCAAAGKVSDAVSGEPIGVNTETVSAADKPVKAFMNASA